MAKRKKKNLDDLTGELTDSFEDAWGTPEPRLKRARRTRRSVPTDAAIGGNDGTDYSIDSDDTNDNSHTINALGSTDAKVRS